MALSTTRLYRTIIGLFDDLKERLVPLETFQQNATSALDTKVDIDSIVNELTSTATDRPLSAAQGKIINDMVTAINDLLLSDDATLDELQEIVNYIKINRDTLQNLSIESIAGLGTALNNKVDKIAGKGLSANDFTDALLAKLNGIDAGAEVNAPTTASRSNSSTTTLLQAKGMFDHVASADHDDRYHTKTESNSLLGTKVDKVAGKGLSTEDYTTGEKTKLAGIEAGAQVNVGTNLSLGGSGDNRHIASSTGSNVALPNASASTAGLMTMVLYNKLIGIEAGAQVNVPTNLNRTLAATSLTITNSNGTNAVLPAATESNAGVLSASDKAKLNSIESGAQANVGTNLTVGGFGNTRTIQSSTGSDAALPLSTSGSAGLMSIEDRTKLDGIQSGAQVNVGTNLSASYGTGAVVVASSTGNNATINGATESQAGVLSAADKAKLNLVGTMANRNVTISDSDPPAGVGNVGDFWFKYKQ